MPIKIILKIKFYYDLYRYDQSKFEEKQNNIFEKNSLDRNFAKKKISKIKDQYKFLNREMSSEHEVVFASISQDAKRQINNILEIGTFDGINSFLLAELFPKAQIDTIDLSHEDKDFKDFYDRGENFNSFKNERDKIIAKKNNVNFIVKNSVQLTESKKKYDLIWVYGALGYPVVSIDIINSIYMLNNNGIIMIDDIFVDGENYHKMYNSIAAFETLSELKKNKIIKFDLIFKRLDANNNCSKQKRKFVAIVKKI